MKSILALSLILTLLCAPTRATQAGRYIVNGPIVVEPKSYVDYTFGNRLHEDHITGKFRARGGSGNDIVVWILSEEDFENWRNGHPSEFYYCSGKVTAGHFDVTVPKMTPGQPYHLVFSNTFSSISNKVVTAEVHEE